MATKKKKNAPAENGDLGFSGPGVAPVKIGAIHAAIRKYLPAKERRVEASRDEVSAKQKLVGLLHDHAAEIGRDEHGIIRYHFDGQIVMLAPSDEKLVIKQEASVAEE